MCAVPTGTPHEKRETMSAVAFTNLAGMTTNAPDKSKRSRTRELGSLRLFACRRVRNLIGERKSRRIAIEAGVLVGQGSCMGRSYPGFSVRSRRFYNVA